jgi:hypothetical protein
MALPTVSSYIRACIVICDWPKHSRRNLQDGLPVVIAHVLFLVDKRSLMSRTF